MTFFRVIQSNFLFQTYLKPTIQYNAKSAYLIAFKLEIVEALVHY